MPDAEAMVLHNSQVSQSVCRLSGPLFLSLAGVSAYCALMNARSDGDWGAFALFFILGSVCAYLGALGIRWLLRRKPPVVISREGITEEYFGFELIPWNSILAVEAAKSFSSRSMTAFKTLYLKVQNPDEFRSRVPSWVRPLLRLYSARRDALPLDFTYLDGNLEEAIERIKTFRPEIPVT